MDKLLTHSRIDFSFVLFMDKSLTRYEKLFCVSTKYWTLSRSYFEQCISQFAFYVAWKTHPAKYIANLLNSVTKNICHYSKRVRTCHLLWLRPWCYYSSSKTHVRDRIFEFTSIHASVIYQIPWIRRIHWTSFNVEKTPVGQEASEIWKLHYSLKLN